MQKLLLIMLLSTTVCGVAYSQKTITGKVATPDGMGLPGVSILVKGTTVGTTSDAQGAYRLDVPANAETLLFSFIGYTTVEETIGTRSIINTTLLEDIKSLEEIVVIGYGTTSTKRVTGAVAAVNGNDLVAINPTRFDQAMQGQMAGVQVSTASGSPGGGMNIRIRGLSTNGKNAPLVIVDGIQYSNDPQALNALNPADIESINVLKDAAAAIYGVRAANGVVIVTTKQGRKNTRSTLELSGYHGVQQTANKLDLVNAREFAILKNEMYASGGNTPLYNNVNLGQGTDWQNEVFQTAPISNYNLSLSGGGEKSTFSIGGSVFDQKGIVGGDKASYKRYNARINFSTELAPKLTLNNVLLYTNEARRTLPENTISSVLYNTINASPLATPRTPEGKFSYLMDVNDVINPLAQIENSHNKSVTNKLFGKQELNYKITNNIEATGRIGYSYAVVDYKQFNPLVFYGVGKAQNSARDEQLTPNTVDIAPDVSIPVYNSVNEQKTTYNDYNFEAFLNYSNVFAEVHSIKAVLGTSFINEEGHNLSGTAYNIPYNSVTFADISAADGANLLNNTSSYQYRSRLYSIFARAEYGYDDKYLFTAIIRRDASTRFGKNNRFGYFPSVSAGWIVSEEEFFNVPVIPYLKFRASYGVSGNDQIDNFVYRALLNGEAVYPFNDQLVTGIAVGTPANPDLKWETTRQTNFGLDFNLFSDRITVGVDYYVKKTSDLLFRPDVSAIIGSYGAGGNPPWINGGDIRNSGLEFMIEYASPTNRDFNWNIKYNLTTIKNEVVALPTGVDFFEFGSFSVGGGNATRMQVGKPMGYFFGYKTEGVYQTAEEVAGRGVTQNLAKPGDLRFADLDGDNNVNFGNDSDKTMIGSPIPDLLMGLSIGANYKGIDFSALFYSSIGNDILRNYERQQPLANVLAYRKERWTGPGSTNEHPRLTTELNNNNVISDYFVEDGSFIRLKNVQLGYSLPKTIVDKIGASRLRVYVAANNLFTLTKYRGFDPEFASSDPTVSGIDYGFYPQARIFMAGFNLNF